jgi:23S rRNA (pseudouridine1915-N3)-methyltransferase
LNVCILCVGKLKADWQRDACAQYLKRLTRYARVEVVEVPDQPEPQRASKAQLDALLEREGRELLRRIRPDDRVVALCIEGRAPDSVALARMLEGWSDGRRLVLVIGGSLGLGPQVLARAEARLSFSNLTFPHPLMRVILLEQIYRSARILSGQRYHK